MLSMFRSNLYRMVHMATVQGIVVAYVLLIAASIVMMRVISDGAADEFAQQFFGAVPVPPCALYGRTLVSSSLLGIFAVASCLFPIIADFNKGFIKNLMQIRGGRTAYVGAAFLTIPVMCAAYLLIGVLVSEVLFRVAGFGVAMDAPDVAGLLLWFAQTLLVTVAYAAVSLCVALCIPGAGTGTAATLLFLLPAGGLESILQLVFSNVFPTTPALRDCMDNLLHGTYIMLATGPVSGAQPYVVTSVAIAVALVISVVAMRHKDIK